MNSMRNVGHLRTLLRELRAEDLRQLLPGPPSQGRPVQIQRPRDTMQGLKRYHTRLGYTRIVRDDVGADLGSNLTEPLWSSTKK